MPKHLKNLKQVFNLAAKFNLKFSLDKCTFVHNSVEYLVYIVNKSGLHPSPRNINSVNNFSISKNQKHVLQFAGLASYLQ